MVINKINNNLYEFTIETKSGEARSGITVDFSWNENPEDDKDRLELKIIKQINKYERAKV